MSHTVVALTTLTDERVRADYERWLREVDAPTAAAMPGVLGFRVLRLEGPVLEGVGAVGHHYLELIEVADLDGFRTAMAGLPASFHEALRTYIGGMDVAHAAPVVDSATGGAA
ncbi:MULTISPECIES: hypothetical protein [Pseudonocardia]|uniref:REDY-like protein HapK n=2 Tax=Pseudonocardia TaxID=1847 RepID=A0A1Y2N6W9_PSEAH|nr:MULTISPECIES: hypothetical protein [Pseudonocardia]OSY43222.1 hypothetical protein BG845_00827 [Pseudonocardia autotrophica]TDN71710.1 REDY-like protein HapK [Pseudonocardia autotrophica]BBG02397.1 hypothetical protein Pdca_36060 [Pseudonocardia autotrophica]GEC23267.1 hypothetical protein PSA01_02960 [Pseudonocardia saturnea]